MKEKGAFRPRFLHRALESFAICPEHINNGNLAYVLFALGALNNETMLISELCKAIPVAGMSENFALGEDFGGGHLSSPFLMT